MACMHTSQKLLSSKRPIPAERREVAMEQRAGANAAEQAGMLKKRRDDCKTFPTVFD
jgi:hypothetical protein